MIYNLYIEANKQAHIVRLREQKGTIVQYLTINTQGRDELLTIDRTVVLVSSTCVADDKKVFVSEIRLDGNSIMITLDDKKNVKDTFSSNDSIHIRDDKKSIVIENATDG